MMRLFVCLLCFHIGACSVFDGACTQKLLLTEQANTSFRPGCHGLDPMQEALPGRMYISSNHKTGTVLGKCLRNAMSAELGINVECLSRHTTGGFSERAFQVNFVRNPFLLVHSGYRYHKLGSESWTSVPFRDMDGSTPQHGFWQGARHAYMTWRQWCNSNTTGITDNSSYASVLKLLSVEQGLVLESLRALYRDIPFVVSSARDCFLTNSAVTGACKNVLMDDFVSNISDRIEMDVATTLRLSDFKNYLPGTLGKVASACDPRALIARESVGGRPQQHITSLGKYDVVHRKNINQLRYIDEILFEGSMKKAEEKLRRYVDAS